MYFPLELGEFLKIKDPPWSQLQYLCSNRLVLSDDSHFAIYNLETHKIQTSFDELNRYKSDIYAVFVTRNSATVLILLKNEQLLVFDILSQSITKQFSNLPRILKEAFVKPELQEAPVNQSKIKTFLQGIYQSETKHDFQTRLSLEFDGMDYENDSLIIIIRKEFLIHQSGTWYSYQRPLKPIACLPFYDDTTSCWNTLQLNEDGLLVFCQLAVTQMICSDIQMPIRHASNVIIKGQLISKCPFGVFISKQNSYIG